MTGLHRAPAQAATGAIPLPGDLVDDTVEELAAKISGHDAVVFAAGAHGTGRDLTTAIDGRGLEKAADAATRAGVSRFVLVSVFPEALRGQGATEGFEHYAKIKKTADVYLTRTELDSRDEIACQVLVDTFIRISDSIPCREPTPHTRCLTAV